MDPGFLLADKQGPIRKPQYQGLNTAARNERIMGYFRKVNFQRLIIVMALSHGVPLDQQDELNDQLHRLFDDNPYFSRAWDQMNKDVYKVFEQFGRGSWDAPTWRYACERMPGMIKVDFISNRDGCDMCGRSLEYAVSYRNITIEGPRYDEQTMVSHYDAERGYANVSCLLLSQKT